MARARTAGASKVVSANFERYSAFTRALADFTARTLQDELDLEADRAQEIGLKISLGVSEEFAGENLYVAKDTQVKTDQRDREMLSVYIASGRDILVVAKQFGVCVQTAYRRVRITEAALNAERQGSFFDDPVDPDALD